MEATKEAVGMRKPRPQDTLLCTLTTRVSAIRVPVLLRERGGEGNLKGQSGCLCCCGVGKEGEGGGGEMVQGGWGLHAGLLRTTE